MPARYGKTERSEPGWRCSRHRAPAVAGQRLPQRRAASRCGSGRQRRCRRHASGPRARRVATPTGGRSCQRCRRRAPRRWRISARHRSGQCRQGHRCASSSSSSSSCAIRAMRRRRSIWGCWRGATASWQESEAALQRATQLDAARCRGLERAGRDAAPGGQVHTTRVPPMSVRSPRIRTMPRRTVIWACCSICIWATRRAALPELERYKTLTGEDKPVSTWIADAATAHRRQEPGADRTSASTPATGSARQRAARRQPPAPGPAGGRQPTASSPPGAAAGSQMTIRRLLIDAGAWRPRRGAVADGRSPPVARFLPRRPRRPARRLRGPRPRYQPHGPPAHCRRPPMPPLRRCRGGRRSRSRRRAAASDAAHGAQRGTRGRDSVDRIELGTTEISGNRELPKVMYMVPWRATRDWAIRRPAAQQPGR